MYKYAGRLFAGLALGAISTLSGVQDVYAESAFCASAPTTWSLTITGPGLRFDSAGVTLEAGEELSFSTVSSPSTPNEITILTDAFGFTGSGSGTTVLDVSLPDNTRTTASITAVDNGTNLITYRASADAFGSPATVNIEVSCTPASTGGGGTGGDGTGDGGGTDGGGTGGGLTPAEQRANLNKSAVQFVYGFGPGDGFGIGADKAGDLLGKESSPGLAVPEWRKVLQDEEELRKADELREQEEAREAAIRTLEKRLKRLRSREQRLKATLEKNGEWIFSRVLQYYYDRETKSYDLGRLVSEEFESDFLDGIDDLRAASQRSQKYYKILEQYGKSIRELERLKAQRFQSVRGQLGGVIVPVSAPISETKQNFGQTQSSVFRLAAHGDNTGSFVADIASIIATPAGGSPKVDPLNYDVWLSGRFSLLDDGSSVGRDGYSTNLSLGGAVKLSDRVAISGEIIGRFADLEVDQVQSETEMNGVGFALSGVVALTDEVRLGVTGFYEHGWFDTSVAGATGAYDADRYGISGILSGTYNTGALVFQPALSVLYSRTDLTGYTDSTSVVVPGQSIEYGTLNGGLTISRPMEGRGTLVYWQPYAVARIHYDFRKENNFAIGPNLIVNDSRTNGEVGGGAQFNFERSVSASIGATYYGLFGEGANSINVGAQIAIPLN